MNEFQDPSDTHVAAIYEILKCVACVCGVLLFMSVSMHLVCVVILETLQGPSSYPWLLFGVNEKNVGLEKISQGGV